MNINKRLMLGYLVMATGLILFPVAISRVVGPQVWDFVLSLLGGGFIALGIWAAFGLRGSWRSYTVVGCVIVVLFWLVYLSSWNGEVNWVAILVVALVALGLLLTNAATEEKKTNGRALVFRPTGRKLPVSRLIAGAIVVGFALLLSFVAGGMFPRHATVMNQIVFLVYFVLTLVGILNTKRDMVFVSLLWVMPLAGLLLIQLLISPTGGNVFRWLLENPEKWHLIGIAYLFHVLWLMKSFVGYLANSFFAQNMDNLLRDRLGGILGKASEQVDEAVTWALFPFFFYFLIVNIEKVGSLEWESIGFWLPFAYLAFWLAIVRHSNEIRENLHWVGAAILVLGIGYYAVPWYPAWQRLQQETDGAFAFLVLFGSVAAVWAVTEKWRKAKQTSSPPASRPHFPQQEEDP